MEQRFSLPNVHIVMYLESIKYRLFLMSQVAAYADHQHINQSYQTGEYYQMDMMEDSIS